MIEESKIKSEESTTIPNNKSFDNKKKTYILSAVIFILLFGVLGWNLYRPHEDSLVNKITPKEIVLDPNAFLIPANIEYSEEWYSSLFIEPVVKSSLVNYLNVDSGNSKTFRKYLLVSTEDGYYMISPASPKREVFVINKERFAEVISYLNGDIKNRDPELYFVEFKDQGEIRVSIAFTTLNDGAGARVYTSGSNDYKDLGIYDQAKVSEVFTFSSLELDQNISKQCETYFRMDYKGTELNNLRICYYDRFSFAEKIYYVDKLEGGLSLIEFDIDNLETKTLKLPDEVRSAKLFRNDIYGYKSSEQEDRIIAFDISLYQKDLNINKLVVNSRASTLSFEPVLSKDVFYSPYLGESLQSSLFTTETDSKSFEYEVKNNEILVKTKDFYAPYNEKAKLEYTLPLSSYKQVLEELDKLRFISPGNMTLRSIETTGGIGGGGGPDERPFITIRVNKEKNLLTMYLIGYISEYNENKTISKTLIRQYDYNLSTNELVKDTGYKYFDSIHTSAYSSNYIRQFNDDKNNFVFASGGGDGCGGGSSYSFLNMNTSQVTIKLDVLAILASGCETIENYNSSYASFRPKVVGNRIGIYNNLVYFATKERDNGDYIPAWDNVNVLDLNTGTTRLIRQFPQTPKYYEEVTYEYMESIGQEYDTNVYELPVRYIKAHNGSSSDELFDIYKLDLANSTLTKIETNFKFP